MKRLHLLILIVAIKIALLLLSGDVSAQVIPFPDVSFGNGGQVLDKVKSASDDIGKSVVIQNDDKIVVAGSSDAGTGAADIVIMRYKKNGQPDKSFNGTGKKVIKNACCSAMAVQPDGKLVICGSKKDDSHLAMALWRLNSNGTADATFGNAGEQVIALSNDATCCSILIQPDGKMLIAGHDGSFKTGNAALVIARINMDGRLDTSFSRNGIFTRKLYQKNLACRKLLLQPDGNIIAAGQMTTTDYRLPASEFFALRIHGNGMIDSSFAVNGMFSQRNSNSDNCYTAGLLPDGHVLLAGSSQFTGYMAASVLGLTANGSVDHTFGKEGWVYPNYFGSSNAMINSIVIQQDGKILLAGSAGYSFPSVTAVTLARLKRNGALDQEFGIGGMDTSFVTALNAIACNDMTLMNNGKIIITGYKAAANDWIMTARYLNDVQELRLAESMESSLITDLKISPVPVRGDTATISFTIGAADVVTVRLYDINGQEMITPVSWQVEKGRASNAIFLPAELPAGIYFCNVKSKEGIESITFELER